jgi:GTP cyclohydrolase I
MAYEVSQKRVLGLRKFMRLRLCTGHLQLQEHLAEELANALVKATDGGSVLILLEAEHLCTRMRWLRSEGACYVTRALRGNFAGDTALLSDMLAMIRLGRTGL